MIENKLKKLYSIFVPFIILLSQYLIFPGISIADFLLIIFFLVYIIKCNKNIVITRNNVLCLLLCLLLLLSTFIALISQSDYNAFELITRYIRFSFYLIMGFIITPRLIDFHILIITYKNLLFFISTFLIIQSFVFYFTGFYINGIVNFLPISNELYTFKPIVLNGQLLRANSVFFEPGYYAHFAIPFLVYIVFLNKRNIINKNFYIVLILVSLILSTSGQGIILGFVILLISWLINIKKQNILGVLSILFLVAFLVVIFEFLNVKLISNSFSRLFGGNSSSSGVRIYRGFEIFNKLPIQNKIFGVGYGNIGNFVIENNITTSFDAIGLVDYVSSFTNLLISCGYIGGILFISLFYVTIKIYNQLFQIITIMCLFILCFVSGVFISIVPILFLSISTTNVSSKKNSNSLNESFIYDKEN